MFPIFPFSINWLITSLEHVFLWREISLLSNSQAVFKTNNKYHRANIFFRVYVTTKRSDQFAHPRRLISAFDACIHHVQILMNLRAEKDKWFECALCANARRHILEWRGLCLIALLNSILFPRRVMQYKLKRDTEWVHYALYCIFTIHLSYWAI